MKWTQHVATCLQWHLAQVADLEGFNRSKSLHAEYVGAGLKKPKLVIGSRIAASLCIIDLIVSDWSPTKQPEMLVKRSISGWRHGHGGPAHPSKCAFRPILMMQMHFDT